MARFGKIELTRDTSRDVDSSTLPPVIPLENVDRPKEQEVADIASAERLLALDKTQRVLNVAAHNSELNGAVIIVPQPGSINSFNPSVDVNLVRSLLQRYYNNETESGNFIRFPLFKKIVDEAVKKQTRPIEDIIGPFESEEFTSALHNLDVEALSALISNPKIEMSSVNHYSPNDGDKNGLLQSIMFIGVAALSLHLIKKYEIIKPLASVEKDREEEQEKAQEEAAITPEEKKAIAAANRAKRIQRILVRLAKAVAMFALIHKLAQSQAEELFDREVAPFYPDFPDETQQARGQVVDLYTVPDEEMLAALNEDVDNPDRVIMEFCMDYISKFNGKNSRSNFTSWIVYASSSTTVIAIKNVEESLAETSSVSRMIVNSEPIVSSSARPVVTPVPNASPATIKNMKEVLKDVGKLEFGLGNKIDKFLGKLDGSSTPYTMEVNIMDYVDMSRKHVEESSFTNDYFMNLMKNNKYTPELVCCLINFIIKAFSKSGKFDAAKALKFLESLRSMLDPVNFNYGKLAQDIINRLFSDIKSKLLSYAITKLTKYVEAQKARIRAFLEELGDDNEFIKFCTPLLDMIDAIMKVIDMIKDAIKTFLKDLADFLLSFEIELNPSLINLSFANRNLLLRDLLDSLIFALRNGKLCNYKGLEDSDLHPEALDLVDSTATQPDKVLDEEVDQFNFLVDYVRKSFPLSDLSIAEFDDPADPDQRGAISTYRRNQGESIMETLMSFSGNCNSIFKDGKVPPLSFGSVVV